MRNIRECLDEFLGKSTPEEEEALSIDKVTIVTVLLGYGGPTEYFEITFNDEGIATHGKYCYTKCTGSQRISLSDAEIDIIVDRYNLTA